MSDTTIYLVRQIEPDDLDGSTLWWSNEDGFGSLDQAVVYTAAEQQALKPPIGGMWVKFTTRNKG